MPLTAASSESSCRTTPPPIRERTDMNRIRTRFLPVALAAVALLTGATSASAQLTLEDAIAIAIKNNRDINAASHSVATANLAITTARSYRLPQFEVQTLAAQSITPLGVD